MSAETGLSLEVCGLSDVGRVREHNEDSFEVDLDRRIYVVADGMGGHRHGEVASRIAVESILGDLRAVESSSALENELPEHLVGLPVLPTG